MRNRSYRSDSYANPLYGDVARSGGASAFSSLRRLVMRRPRDTVSFCLAAAASALIVVNALFLQAGPHPAPLLAVSTPAATGAIAARPAKTPSVAQDRIAEIAKPSNRVMAVQRALAEFGYGQVKADGLPGPETSAAIEKFERERNLPVTGQLSERLARELAAMTGRPI